MIILQGRCLPIHDHHMMHKTYDMLPQPTLALPLFQQQLAMLAVYIGIILTLSVYDFKDGDVIRCICCIYREEGVMIQCERCHVSKLFAISP